MELANLVLKVDSSGVTRADREMRQMASTGQRAERATDGLTGAFKRILAPVAALVSVSAGLRKLVDTTKTFQSLNAQLLTATGSANNAATAFEALQDFATSTPYDLEQVTSSFIKLVNYGLDPSERALASYGETAAALGKDLNQMIEAVADAAQGEFERLKEFGIKARNEGDTIRFTFRGVEQSIKNDAASIERYLIELGENNFAGNMAARMDTLEGAMSNLGDEWDKLWNNISEQGIGNVIEESIRTAIGALEDLNAALDSGQFAAVMQANADRFALWADDVQITIDYVTDLWENMTEGVANEGAGAVDFVIQAFRRLPENVRAIVQILAVELGAFHGIVGIIADEIDDMLPDGALLRTIGATFPQFQALTSLMAKTRDDESQGNADFQTQLDAILSARRDSIDAIITERDVEIAAYDAKIASSKELRANYEAERAARQSAGGDSLGQFGISTPAGSSGSGEEATGAPPTEPLIEYSEVLAETLDTNASAWDEYFERLRNNVENTDELQIAMLERFTAGVSDAIADSIFEFTSFEDSVRSIARGVAESVIRALIDIGVQRMTLWALEKTIGASGQASAAAMTTANAQAGSYLAAVNAFASTAAIPIVGPALAPGAAATALAITQPLAAAASAASMAGFAGAFDEGGNIPAGQFGIVGERGPEFVEGPARVTSRKDTAKMLEQAAMRGISEVKLRQVIVDDPDRIKNYLQSDSGEQLLVTWLGRNAEQVRRIVAS